MATRRIQITVSGAPLRWLEDLGETALLPRAQWAWRGLSRVLEERLEAEHEALALIRQQEPDTWPT